MYGTKAGKKQRQKMKSWTLKMKADVMDGVESMKDWSEDAYHKVVDGVAKKYKQMKKVDAAELAVLAADLKRHWKNIRSHVEGGSKQKTAKR